jgi:hypothetical protein
MNPLDELTRLTDLFPGSKPLIELAEHVPQSTVPKPYSTLLVHDQHMTVTMENFHGCPVAVKVLAKRFDDPVYSRKIILTRTDNGRIVQFGIVRFDLSFVTQSVRNEILSEQVPLGRVLINHNVLRHIDLGALLRIVPGPELCEIFGCQPENVTYGRLATIFCNRVPAVDLLEVAAPES